MERWEAELLVSSLGRSVAPDPSAHPPGPDACERSASSVARGEHAQAIADAARQPLASIKRTTDLARKDLDRKHSLALGAACLLAQRRADATGPPISVFPSAIIFDDFECDGEQFADSPAEPPLLRIALDSLAPTSCAPVSPDQSLLSSGRASLVEQASDEPAPATFWWWAFRALATVQRSLEHPSSSIRGCMAVCLSTLLLSPTCHPWSPPLVACIRLEAAVAELDHGLHMYADELLRSSEASIGLTLHLSGAMGYRTTHQRDPKAQLVARAQDTDWSASTTDPIDASASPSNGYGSDEEERRCQIDGETAIQTLCREIDESDSAKQRDVYDGSSLLDGEVASSSLSRYQRLQHALMLAHSSLVRARCAHDDLRSWEESAWARAIFEQKKSVRPSVLFSATLTIARTELERSRTCERGLIRLERLADALQSESAGCSALSAARRQMWIFAVQLPSINLIRRELGDAYFAAGLTGQALNEYHDLHLWNNVVACYRAAGKREEACALLREQLDLAEWNDPDLLCALGEAQPDTSLLEKAWEASGRRHLRSKRNLARDAMKRQTWQKACTHWEDALSLSSLHASDWFAFGHCCMQEGVWQRAHEAFTRSAQIDPSSGEAWNNAAAVALRLQWNSAAYEALKEATKLMPFDWRTHENAATAALRLGYLQKASNSLQSAFRASGKDHLDENGVEAVVSRLITQYQNYEGEKRVREDHDASTKREDLTKAATGEDKDALAAAFDALAERGVADDDEEDDGPSIDRAGAQEEEKEEKCDMDAVEISRTAQIIETLLSEAAEESRCNTRMWGCFAQLKELRGKLNEARDCRAKQVKQLHGSSSLQDSEKALIEYMHAVTHLCELHSQLGEAERSSSVARSAKAAVPNRFEQTEAATKLVKLAERFAG
jgi:hypothetical protein